ncbi:GNAT family N-acetyltransferase [Microbacterium sp. NPDC056003]|uniref:GNAT family N-acetyltransferase n=1 Tax=Microbacterium sp. NPDC056003 TaxID=3345676 RepID=UPI0035E2AE80
MQVVVEKRPSGEFSRALEHLVPADDDLARFVHMTLAQPTDVPKRNVVVLHRGEPVIATTLRLRQDRWELASTTAAPTFAIPHREGMLEPALSALGLPILIIDHVGDAKDDFPRQKLHPFDSYVAPLQGFDFDAYWRSTRLREDIRRAERKASDLQVVQDDAEVVKWSIDTWEGRWTDHPNEEAGAAADLRAVWPELLRRGRLMSTALVTADGAPVASNVNLVDGDTLVGLITARDMSVQGVGSIGTLVAVECFDAARRAGLAKVDIGGFHDHYKRRLAPAGRTAYNVEIEPRLVAADTVAQAERAARALKRRGRRLAASVLGRRAD